MKKGLFLGLIIIFISCSQQGKEIENPVSQEKNKPIDTLVGEENLKKQIIPIDTLQTEIAYYLAGLKPPFSTENPIFNTGNWGVYAKKITGQWLEMEKKRQNDLEKWGKNVLASYINDTLPLFYPFSGPDFLHAHSFYPNASSYVMMALEPVNKIPDLTNMPDNQRDAYINLLKKGLRDVIGKSYFITTHMMEDLDEQKSTGVLPVFYIFLARSGHEIVSVNPIEINEQGKIYTSSDLSFEKNQAVEISYKLAEENKIKKVLYFSRSISNNDLEKKHPNFKTYLNSGLPQQMNGFIKAASYLMHYKGFSDIREALITHSEVIFQDDTGIPLKYIDQNRWDIQLFGAYTRPIKNFSDKMYQPDLRDLYAQTPTEKIKEIPFSLGYHVVGDKVQNHQILIKK